MTDTTPEITPELLRAVGSWLVQQPGSTDMALVEITEQADRLEQERAGEKRVDELAQILIDSRKEVLPWYSCWGELNEENREGFRAGIRAVLAHLEDERTPRFIMNATNDHISAVIEDGEPFVHGRDFTVGERRGAGDEPRQWRDLRDVPVAVTQVRDKDGDAYRRSDNAECKWEIREQPGQWTEIQPVLLARHSPFTEVIADA